MKTHKTVLILLSFIFICAYNIKAQTKIWNNWYFGMNAGISFNTDPPTVLTGGQTSAYTGTASISDENGNLLFYSDGLKVWDKNHNTMPNGTGLLSNDQLNQKVIIIPYPNKPKLYYLFTLYRNYIVDTYYLLYSIIDMNLNNGMGDIDISTKNILLLNGTFNGMTALAKPDGTGFWLIVYTQDQKLHAFSITSSGINTSSVTSNLLIPFPDFISQSEIVFSHDGKKLVYSNYDNTSSTGFSSDTSLLQIYKFDSNNGLFTFEKEYIDYGSPTRETPWYWSFDFSPDNSKLYAIAGYYGGNSTLLQFDMQQNIMQPPDTIYNGTQYNPVAGLKLAPDGKLYLTQIGKNKLARIESPNNSAASCGFVLNAIDLQSGVSRWCLPNTVTYPSIDIYYENTCQLKPVAFNITNSQNIQSVLWNFDDSQTSTELNPTHTYTNAGTYTVTLTVTYNDSTTKTISKQITIYDKPTQPTILHD